MLGSLLVFTPQHSYALFDLSDCSQINQINSLTPNLPGVQYTGNLDLLTHCLEIIQDKLSILSTTPIWTKPARGCLICIYT